MTSAKGVSAFFVRHSSVCSKQQCNAHVLLSVFHIENVLCMLCFKFCLLLCQALKMSTAVPDRGTIGVTLSDFHVNMDTFYTSSLTSPNYVLHLLIASVLA